MDDRERTRARREAAKRLHPDRGGDPAEFDRVMRSLDAGIATETDTAPTAPTGHVFVSAPRTRPARAAKALRTTSKLIVADVRRRLPRSFPGSRRYGHL